MKYSYTLLLIISVFLAGSFSSVFSNAGAVVYFYNPETNINNFATLKTVFDSYLSTQGGFYFQPFDDKNNFEVVVKQKNADVYLLSSWHLEALQKQNIPIEAYMCGTYRGNFMQRKALSAKKDIANTAMLKDTVIAGSGSEEYTRSILKQILGKENESLLEHIKILTVPKDIDALMAVSFGMATAAISAESSLAKLAAINPNQFQQLHNLGFSEKTYILIAASLKKTDPKQTQLLEILRKMSDTSTGEKSLKLLGIDGWKPL
jgi:ABC-type amino acid transport substrate-binding protein